MALIDDLLSYATHPAVAPALMQWATGGAAQKQQEQDRYTALQEQLNALQLEVVSRRRPGRPKKQAPKTTAAPPPPVAAMDPAVPAPGLRAVRDQMITTAGSLKEALRFAREDGIAHPEAQQRIRDVQTWLDALPAFERFDLAPERLAALPPDQRQVWEQALPHLRKLRQVALNQLDTVDGLTTAAAEAGTLGTIFQLGAVTTGATGPGWQAPPSPDVAAPPPPGDGPYSRYAPEMSVDTGCIECGRGHLAAVTGGLKQAVHDAQTRGFVDPVVQQRLAFAQEELAALFQHDWTPDKIAKNPPAERAVLELYRPQVEALWQATRDARDPAALAALTAEAVTIRQGYEAALTVPGPAAFGMIAAAAPATGDGTARVRRERVFMLHQPTEGVVQATTAVPNTVQAFDNLEQAIEGCGVTVRFRALEATPDYILEGQFNPLNSTIQLAPAALSKDSYADQTLQHEISHALLHSLACLPNQPADHARQELQAEDVVIATMLRAGLPIETRDGDVINPGSREIDWDKLAAQWTPGEFENIKWASDWLLAAMQTGQPPTCQTCPVPGGG